MTNAEALSVDFCALGFVLLARGEENGCINLSELDEQAAALELSDEDLETLHERIDAKGIVLTDDCGRQGVADTHFNLSELNGTTTDALQLTPFEYFQRNCYVGASILSPHEVHWIDVLGADRIMWGHDFPHPEGAIGNTVDGLRANFAEVDDATLRMLLAGTAADVYHFDLEALTPLAARIGPPADDVHAPLDRVHVAE